MNKTLLLLLMTVSADYSLALDRKPEKVAQCIITKAGLSKNDIIATVADSNSPTGIVHKNKNMLIYEETTLIPLRKNISFAFHHTFFNIPKGELIDERVTHPKFIKPSGEVTHEYTRRKRPGTGSGYSLDNDFELVRGKWTFEYSYKGKKLCEQSFRVF